MGPKKKFGPKKKMGRKDPPIWPKRPNWAETTQAETTRPKRLRTETTQGPKRFRAETSRDPVRVDGVVNRVTPISTSVTMLPYTTVPEIRRVRIQTAHSSVSVMSGSRKLMMELVRV